MSYERFAERILESGIVTDPWNDGAPRFREEPLFVTGAEQRRFYDAAEGVAAVYDELARMVAADASLLDGFFGLSPWQKAMWLASAPMWHGVARADLFETDDGLAIAELNSDTPTGEAEAVVLGALAAEDHPGSEDPNRDLGARFCDLVELVHERLVDGPAPRAVGFVYPTEFTDDLSLVRLYRRWLEEREWEVILGSPYNLGWDAAASGGGRPLLFGKPFSILLRHYKTDWWGERASVWDDEQIADGEPLEVPARVALNASIERRAAVLNPFGAVLPQNKRSMAFMWEKLGSFSPASQAIIRRHVPETRRLEDVDLATIVRDRASWVLKSDYGAEGDEVMLGPDTTDAAWSDALLHARRGRWVVQRFFRAHVNERREARNLGVFVVAGQAAGLYARFQVGATDTRAISAPVLVRG